MSAAWRDTVTTIDTALMVIDVQESFRHRPYFREQGVPAFLERQQALIDGAKAACVPVVQVFHVEESWL